MGSLYKEPYPVDSLVAVVVADGLMDPTLSILYFGSAIDVSGGVVGVFEIDLVCSYVKDRHAYGCQLTGEVFAECDPTREASFHPDVGHK